MPRRFFAASPKSGTTHLMLTLRPWYCTRAVSSSCPLRFYHPRGGAGPQTQGPEGVSARTACVVEEKQRLLSPHARFGANQGEKENQHAGDHLRCQQGLHEGEDRQSRCRKKLLYAVWKQCRTPQEIRELYRKRFRHRDQLPANERARIKTRRAIRGCGSCSWALPPCCAKRLGHGFISDSPRQSTATSRGCSSNCFASTKCSTGSSRSSNMPSEPTETSDSIIKPTNDLWRITRRRSNLGLLIFD